MLIDINRLKGAYEVVSFRSLIYRIRWTSVFALVLLLGLIYLLITTLPGGYSVEGDIGLYAFSDPPSIEPNKEALMEVEIKNINSVSEMTVVITGLTYDSNLIFFDTYSQNFLSDPINIGPQEVRRVAFRIRSKPEALFGEYRVKISAEKVGQPDTKVEQFVPLKISRPFT